MTLKNRLKKLEEMTFTVDQEDKIISFLKAVEAYILEDSGGEGLPYGPMVRRVKRRNSPTGR